MPCAASVEEGSKRPFAADCTNFRTADKADISGYRINDCYV